MDKKIKVLLAALFFLGAVFSLEAQAQCTLTVVQNELCNSDGQIEIDIENTFTAPFTIDVTYPSGNTETLTGIVDDPYLLTGLGGGIYNIVVTDDNALTSSCSIDLPSEGFSGSYPTSGWGLNGYEISCNGVCDGWITASVFNGGGPPYTFEWYQDSVFGVPFATATSNNTTAFNNQSSLCAGVYVVVITSGTGCQTQQVVALNEPDPLSATSVNVDVLCKGDFTGSIDLTPSGGVSALPYAYSWSGPNAYSATTEDISSLEAGTYTVTITDANDCQDAFPISIDEPTEALSISEVIASHVDVECFGDATGVLEVVGAGGAGNYEYRLDAGSWQPSGVFGSLPEGTYTLDVLDANNCIATTDITINQNALITFNEVSHVDISCAGSLGSFELVAQGGVGNFTYYYNSIPQANGVYNNLTEGFYQITATDNVGCSSDTTIEIEEVDELSLTMDLTDASCFGLADGEIDVFAAGGTSPYTYTVVGVNTQSSGIFSAIPVGTYQVIVEDVNNCSKDTTVIIGQPSQIVAMLDFLEDASCALFADGEIFITALGGSGTGYTYAWERDGSPYSTAENITGLTAADYTVVVTDSDNCSSMPTTFTIGEPAALIVQLDDQVNVSCNGGNDGLLEIDGTGGTAPYSFQWSGASSSTDTLIENLSAGDYTMTITDQENCPSAAVTYSVLEPDSITVDLTPSLIVCHGNDDGMIDAVVSGGTQPYSVDWTPNGGFATGNTTNFQYDNLVAGEYFINITDANSCVHLDSVVVSQNSEMTASFAVTPETCGGDNGLATITVSGGVGPYTYAWMGQQGGFGIGETNPTIQDLSGGLTYSVQVTDNVGCVQVFSVFVDEIISVFIDEVIVSDVLCFGENSGEIQVTAINGTLPYTFELTPGGTFVSNSETIILDNLSDGVYNLQVTDADNCVNTWTSSIIINEPTPLTVEVNTNQTIDNLACFGDNNGEIFLNIEGGTPYPGGTYWLFVNDPSFSQHISSDSITGLSAGNYDLTVQDANGCLASISHTIAEPTPLSVSVSTSDVMCHGGSTGEALVVVDGGTADYTLNIVPTTNIVALSTDSFLLTDLSEGAYFVDVQDANACELLNTTFYIGEPNLLEVINTSSTLESCLGWDATASVTAAGGVEPYTYLWTYDIEGVLPDTMQSGVFNTTANTANPEFLNQGWYYVHIWDYNDCYVLDSVEVNQATSPVLSLVGTVDNECHLDEEGQITLSTTDGNPYYEYSIDGGGSWHYIPTFLNLGEGLYNVMVRDSLGCTDEIEDIQIYAPDAIDVTVSTSTVSCYGSQDGQAIVTEVIGGTSEDGEYSYTWQDNNGVNLWPANLSGMSAMVDNLFPGTYQLVVEDDNECTTIYAPVVIGEPLEVGVDLSVISDFNGVQISCYGEADGAVMAIAGGGTGDFTFSWYDEASNLLGTDVAATFDTLSLLPAGSYSISVIDDNGCTANDEISISQPDSISIDFENVIHIRCEGEDEGQATAIWEGGLGFGAYNVAWTDQEGIFLAATATIEELALGTYTVTISDNNACFNTLSVEINESEILSVQNGGDTVSVSCFGMADATLDLNPTGGWAPYDHNWDDPLNQQAQQAIGIAPGQWYMDVITDANGCIVIDSIFVIEPLQPLSVDVEITDAPCATEANGSILIEPTGGTPDYSYVWNGPSGFTSVNEDISGLEAGVYNLTLTDNHNCEYFATYEVDEPSSPLQISSVSTTNVLCFGENTGTAQLNAGTNISGGTPPYINQDWGGENPNELSAGNYSVEVTDANGCVVTAEYVIYEPESLAFSVLEVTNEQCEDEHGRIVSDVVGGVPFSNGFYNYSIEPNYQVSSSTNPEILVNFPNPGELSDTIFILTITDENGCVLETELELHPARAFDYSASKDVCLGDSVVIDVKYGDYTDYVWSVFPLHESYNNSSTFSYIAKDTATVSVTLTNNNGCVFTDQYKVNVKYPNVYAGEDVGIIRGENTYLSVDGEPNYLWSTGENEQTIEVNPLISTYYVAEAVDPANGCIGSDTVRVFVGMNEGFSPNNDGFNDNWEIDYLNQYESLHIDIYNRWGTLLWSADSPNIENWDGKYNGENLPVGTYYYVINFEESTGKEPLTGPVTIVR